MSASTPSQAPLHESVYRELLRRITTGQWRPGEQLPVELELAAEFDVSRGTLRQAVSRLAAQGLVERTAGRGTFVVDGGRVDYPLADLLGFTEQVRESGRTPGSQVRAVTRESVDQHVPHPFAPNVREALVIERVRTADGEPVALETLRLPLPRFAGVADVDLEQASVYETLETYFGVRLEVGTFALDPAVLDERQAELLDESAGAPAFRMIGAVTDQDDQVVVQVSCLYRRDRYSFSFSMPRTVHADGASVAGPRLSIQHG
ncbi:MAG: GntR family transcriptional regulator [Salana multivorans]|uniref:GntR family transcriptional regulator n=1 Tax=Salana multivorans TaxID=120377 RepID=UPI00095BE360|nr:GntR family transcriptional regulator [Salana multivorans]MBN8881534.1 GntR family transcriptional regulator [Salana multivorans]OJX97797.1 MAG: hypothetical protein BGO96_12765 [Micrococcales bacterium 73-15]